MKTASRWAKFLLKFLIGIVSLLGLYAVIVFATSRITVNADDTDSSDDYHIYIQTNGVHTDVILPIKNDVFDWSKTLSLQNTVSQDTVMSYAAFGWGDREFYLNTPTWADLKTKTALQAAFYLGRSIMHVTFHNQLREDKNCRKIRVSRKEYSRIVDFVNSGFNRTESGEAVFVEAKPYGNNDSFYEGTGKYSLFYTCNSWTNEALKSGGQKAALWTLTDTGIFCHYK